MTLVKVKQKEVVTSQERAELLSFIKYAFPIMFLFVIIFGAYIFNVRAGQLSKEVEQYRNNIAAIEHQNEVINMQITKLFVGRDVVN